ncbi:glutamate racemase [Deltaproteobacteria bacterium]|nr:glutamate racemase [Deltaproteobacteria bacterium]
MSSNQAVGVFDSGMGGLSVLRELKRQLPNENYLYLGDTGRNPYGPKSAETVAGYTLEAAAFFAEVEVKLMVIACNTAVVAALEATEKAFPRMPIIGVVEPGCLEAVKFSKSGNIALIATMGTVKSGVHAARMKELRRDATITDIPAPILVTLVEEGWLDGKVPDAAAERYLAAAFQAPADKRPDCLLLACTHFPLIEASIRKAVGEETILIDPSALTAQYVQRALRERGLLRTVDSPASVRYCVTADAARFAQVGSLFLQERLDADTVELVSLGGIF